MTEEESVVVIVPLPGKWLQPNKTVGSRGGRMAKARETTKYRARVKFEVEFYFTYSTVWTLGGRMTPQWGKVRVEPTMYFKDNRRRDVDNAQGSLKAAFDGIVDAGLVEDDSPEYMERVQPVLAVDKEDPRVELKLTRLA